MTLLLVVVGWVFGGWLSQTPTETPPGENPPVVVSSIEPGAEPTPFEALTQADLNVITGNVLRPNGMVWFNDKLYVVCTGDWTIYEIDSVTGDTRTYVYGIRNGHMLVAEPNNSGNANSVTLWAPDFDTERLLNIVNTRAPQAVADPFENPWGIAVLDAESFLITNLGDGSLVRVDREGETTEVAEGFRSPTGIAMDDERVYIANSGSARRSIEWVDKASVLAGEPVVPEALVRGLQNTSGLVFAPDGYLYFTYALGTRGVVGRVEPGRCAAQGGCDNDEAEVVIYTDLSAPLAGLTISDDMRLFVHTMFRPEIYWVQLPDPNAAASAEEE
jgi:hypothetical protein